MSLSRWLVLAFLFCGGASLSVQASGLTVIATFDGSISKDPRGADIIATINAALLIYQQKFSDDLTVNIKFVKSTDGLGLNLTFVEGVTYADYRRALFDRASTLDDVTALAGLPENESNPVNNDPDMILTAPLARLLGLGGERNGRVDSTIKLNFSQMNILPSDNDPEKFSLTGAVLHEVDEVLGLQSELGRGTDGPIGPMDLFRYDKTGKRSFTRDSGAQAFFSLDGTTDLVQFNQDGTGDYGDWLSVNGSPLPQVQDAFGTAGVVPLFVVEPRALDVIGYTRVDSSVPGVINPTVTSAASCAPSPALIGSPVLFSVSASIADGSTLTYAWDFGDASTGGGATTGHTYTAPGTYLARVTVRSPGGGFVASSVSVTVAASILPATLTKKKFTLNFKTGKDALDVTLSAEAFRTVAQDADVQILVGAGRAFDQAALVSGKAVGNVGKFVLSTKTGTLKYTSKGASLQKRLEPFGATETPASGTVSVPIYVLCEGMLMGGVFEFQYAATAGKMGVGK